MTIYQDDQFNNSLVKNMILSKPQCLYSYLLARSSPGKFSREVLQGRSFYVTPTRKGVQCDWKRDCFCCGFKKNRTFSSYFKNDVIIAHSVIFLESDSYQEEPNYKLIQIAITWPQGCCNIATSRIICLIFQHCCNFKWSLNESTQEAKTISIIRNV